jgi:hypothetical protein
VTATATRLDRRICRRDGHVPKTDGDGRLGCARCGDTLEPDVEELSPSELLTYIGRATDGSDVTKDEVAAFLRAGHDAKTEARVLGWLSRVAKKARKAVGAGDVEAEVIVRAAHRGRVTGFSLVCLGCGLVAPRLAPSKKAAKLAAIGHLRTDHDSVGRIEVP